MRRLFYIFLILTPIALLAQKSVDVTGRISFRMLNVDYDDQSDINPDSTNYGKSILIPGLQQRLNIALFARTQTMDITLLGDLNNDKWMKLDRYKNVDRLSLSARFADNEIILGDFFDSGSELFLMSREIRGGKVFLKNNNLWNKDSYLKTTVSGGIVQRALETGEPIRGYYKQFVSSGIYRRYFGLAQVELGQNDLFEFGLNFLYGKDDEESIETSLNEPLKNMVAGANATVDVVKNNVQLFGEFYMSQKDTVSANNIKDNAYKGGIDLRFNEFKFRVWYQRIGYEYYTAGFPFLLNDREGLVVDGAWRLPEIMILTWESEQYHDNLNKQTWFPETTTRMVRVGVTTQFNNMPEFTVRGQFRDDLSGTIYNEDDAPIRTDKASRTIELNITHSFGASRLMLSGMYIDLKDHSVLPAGTPLGTDQIIGNFNFYIRPAPVFFLSGGAVYSSLNLTNNQKNVNLVLYESSRWDLIPRLLFFETNVSYVVNDANGAEGYQDLLSNYNQLSIEFSFEYFFSSYISLKAIGGTDGRTMDYSRQDALDVIGNPDYGDLYFNGYESYNGYKYGAEINWLF